MTYEDIRAKYSTVRELSYLGLNCIAGPSSVPTACLADRICTNMKATVNAVRGRRAPDSPHLKAPSSPKPT